MTTLLFLEMISMTGLPPGKLLKDFESKYGASHFKRTDFRLQKPIVDKAAFAAKIIKKLPKKVLGAEIRELVQTDGLKVVLAQDHWVLMRPSGTEPLMRIYAETDSQKRTEELLALARKWVSPSLVP